MFNEVFDYFRQHGLMEKFIYLLEPSILAGRFRDDIIPDRILRFLIVSYEKKQDFVTLEKLIQQLNFSQYTRMEDLQAVCQHNYMISALLHLFTSMQNTAKMEDDSRQNCLQVLNSLYKMLIKSKETEKAEKAKDSTLRIFC